MSGIAASFGDIAPDEASRMLARLEHRGQAGVATIVIDRNWLGCRSSIPAGERGQQPFSNASGSLLMVGDGEVYNHDQLDDVQDYSRATLQSVLPRFDVVGPRVFAEIDGMFCVIIAGTDRRFLTARDHLGIKPLYWAQRDGTIRFASEVGAFDVDWLPFVEFFPPGHYWSPETGLVQFASSLSGGPSAPDVDTNTPGTSDVFPEELLAHIRDTLITSVEQQMVGETEVAAFLSGGLDSSLIAAIAQRKLETQGKRLKTFAVGLAGSPDLRAAREVAAYLDTDHYEKTYTAEDALNILPEVIRMLENFDPSLVRSAVANSLLSEFASGHASIVLTGEGADEIFAGYEYLKSIPSKYGLQQEILGLMEGLHNGGLQRVDRTTMAHGVEARFPFLSEDMISLAVSIAPKWKISGDGQPEKRLLREAFEGWLPESMLWRKKAQFGDGSGAVDVLKTTMAATVTESEFEHERYSVVPPLRTREEVAYYRLFAKHFEGARPEKIVGRFATA